MSRQYPEKNNPFADEDTGFSSSKTSHYGGARASGQSPTVGWGEEADYSKPRSRYEQLQDMKQNSMNNQLETTQRMMSSIYESERMGHATAEELVHQGEQLDNIERKTDDMNKTMDTSQKHLNNIKSIFGGIKNWWSKGKDEKQKEKQEEERTGPQSERLRSAMMVDKSHLDRGGASEHPALRVRNDTSGFYEDSSSGYERSRQDDPFRSNDPVRDEKFASPSMQEYDKQFNQNVDMMSDGMSRLKGLAMGLGDEIQKQNDQIDRVQTKVEKTDTKLEGQNKQIRKILYK